MAGNVPLFTPPGTQSALVEGVARHLAPGGCLIAGFQLDRGYTDAEYDADCTAAGLRLAERFATWDREPYAERRHVRRVRLREAVGVRGELEQLNARLQRLGFTHEPVRADREERVVGRDERRPLRTPTPRTTHAPQE